MTGKVTNSSERVFWCNTNRGAGPGENGLERRMHARGFVAAWTDVEHPDGTFNYPEHMRRARRGDMVFMYANGLGIIGVGRVSASRIELLFANESSRLRDFTTEGKNEEEWRIPVEWLVWDDTNCCEVEFLRPTFQEITEHAGRVLKVRQHFGL